MARAPGKKKKHSKSALAFEKKKKKVGKGNRRPETTSFISKSVVLPCQFGAVANSVPTTYRKQSLQVSINDPLLGWNA